MAEKETENEPKDLVEITPEEIKKRKKTILFLLLQLRFFLLYLLSQEFIIQIPQIVIHSLCLQLLKTQMEI